MAQTNNQAVTFGEWLLGQCSRDDARGDLASAAKANPRIPRRGTPDDGRKWLHKRKADGDMHAVVDDAETDWMAS